MDKIKQFIIDKKEIMITFLVVFLVLMIPYFNSKILIGADYEYHFTRIYTITEALEEGIFPVKIHPSMANGYGYGTGFFYPNFFLYIPAILGLLGVEFILAYKIFVAFFVILIFVFTYISFKSMLEDRNEALIGTAIYMLSNCLTLHLYQRAAIGEFIGLAFIPLVIAGMHDYIYKDFKKPYLIVLGFFGIINSHLISAFLCAIYAVIIFLINIKVSIKNKKNFIKLVLCAILVAMITSCFWMPMLEQMLRAEYKYKISWIKVEETKFGIFDLFGLGNNCFGLLITICIPLIIYGLWDKSISKDIKKYILEVLILVVIMISPWFWNITKFIFGKIQFKWRLLNITTAIVSAVIAKLLNTYSNKFKVKINIKLVLVIILILLTLFYFCQNQSFNIVNNQVAIDHINSLWWSLGGGTEYLPLELNVASLAFPNCVLGENFEKIPYVRENGVLEFKKTNPNENIVNPPFVYYYGYVADITDEAGVTYPLEVRKSDKALVEVVTEGKTGTVRVWYNGTKIQKISYLITMLGIGVIIILGVYNFAKKLKIKNKK